MNKTMNNILVFAAGAAVGVLATYKFFKTKYERKTQEDIESVKEVFSNRYESEESATDEIKMESDDEEPEQSNGEGLKYAASKPDLMKYAELLDAYRSQTPEDNEKGGVDTEYPEEPYVISPDLFGDEPGYDQVYMTCYSDNVLEDDYFVVEDDNWVDINIGRDCLNHFGEYQDDMLWVRNDLTKTDYEISYDHRTYQEAHVNNAPAVNNE